MHRCNGSISLIVPRVNVSIPSRANIEKLDKINIALNVYPRYTVITVSHKLLGKFLLPFRHNAFKHIHAQMLHESLNRKYEFQFHK